MKSRNFLATIQLFVLGLLTILMVSSCGIFSQVGQNEQQGHSAKKKHEILIVASSDGPIDSYSFNANTLKAEHTGSFFTKSPSAISLNSTDDVLYIANSLTNQATITSARFNKSSGLLTEHNSSFVKGKGPVAIDVYGDKLVSANEVDGSITLFHLDRIDGRLKEADWRIDLGEGQISSPTDVTFTVDGAHLYVVDRGQDMIYHFRVHATTPPLTIDNRNVSLKKGTKPLEIIFDRSGRDAYLLCEEDTNIYHYRYNDGTLELKGTYDTKRVFGTKGTSIAIHPNGRFLYATHRGSTNGITVFNRNSASGELSRIETQVTGANPRKIVLSPKGDFIAIASEGASQVEIYKLNLTTGLLAKSGSVIKSTRPIDMIWGSYIQ